MKSALSTFRTSVAGAVTATGLAGCLGAVLAPVTLSTAHAQTEVHYQYGSQTNPFTEVSNGTTVLTMQHASQWKFGDNFYFIDLIDDGSDDGFNEMDAYGEWYSNFSLGKLSGNDLALGPSPTSASSWGPHSAPTPTSASGCREDGSRGISPDSSS